MNVGTLVAELKADVSNFEKEINKSKKKIDELGRKVGSESKKMNTGFVGAMGGMQSRMKKFSNATRTLRYALLGLGTAGAILGAKFAIDVASDMEQARVSFTTMLGSAKEASKLLKKVADFAEKTPFELPDVIKGAKSLKAFGIQTSKIIPTLKSLGDAAAALDVDIDRLILAYGKMSTKGKASMEELNIVLEAGVPILDELAKMLDKSKEEIMEMVSAGEIKFPLIEKAFQRMSGEGGRFEDMMEKQAKTFRGIVSNIKDSAVRIGMDLMGLSTDIEDYGAIIEGGLFDKIKIAAQGALTWIEEHGEEIRTFVSDVGKKIGETAVKVANLVKRFNDLSPSTKALIGKIVALGLALVVLAPTIEKIFWILGALGKTAQWVFPIIAGGTMAVNPLVIAIGLATGGIIVWHKWIRKLPNPLNKLVLALAGPTLAFGYITERVADFKDELIELRNWIHDLLVDLGLLERKLGGIGAGPGGGKGGGGIKAEQEGGPVEGGEQYLVGEKGPELFVPDVSGMIIPNDKLGGGNTVIINNPVVDSMSRVEKMRRVIGEELNRFATNAKVRG